MRKKPTIVTILVCTLCALLAVLLFFPTKDFNPNPKFSFGDKVDSLDGVYVFYNGSVSHTEGRNKSEDGYNLGLKYQCVEFVKRYYYEHFKHKMPDPYGNAKDFFDPNVKDNTINKSRDLLQFRNPSSICPAYGDLLVMDGHTGNKYGHVAIISKVDSSLIEITQQNPGPFAPSRLTLDLEKKDGNWLIKTERVLGWLRMKDNVSRGTI